MTANLQEGAATGGVTETENGANLRLTDQATGTGPSRKRKVAFWLLAGMLSGPKGLKVFGAILLCWYIFWGIAIKPKSIPPVFSGQLTVWIVCLALLLVFYGCLARSRRNQSLDDDEKGLAFAWRGFGLCVVVGTIVTTAARLWLHAFGVAQIAVFFTFYVIAGLALLVGSVRYASGGHR